MKKVLFLALFALFAACTAKLPVVSSADVTRGQALYPGYTLEQLQAGEMIFKQNCGKCHPLKKVNKYSLAELDEVLPKMTKRAKLKPEDAELVTRYARVMQGAAQ